MAFYCSPAAAQLLPREALIEDLEFLNEACVKGHPVNYDPEIKVNITPILAEAKLLKTDSITAMEYRVWVDKALYAIGCAHTFVLDNPLQPRPDSLRFLPLDLIAIDTALYIASANEHCAIGRQVFHVNGIAASALLADVLPYRASDGGSDALGRQYFNTYSSVLLSAYFGFPKLYEVDTLAARPDGSEPWNLDAASNMQRRSSPSMKMDTLLSGRSAHLLQTNEVKVLRIKSFNDKDTKFFKQCTQRLIDDGTKTLIIDLRGNGGGNRFAAIALASHLLDTTISFSMLQPLIDSKPYLDKDGLRKYRLSRLKYNVSEFYRGRKRPLGRSFGYSYKPHRINYNGAVYVLSDGFTSSSSTMLMTWLEMHSAARFAGLQPGGGYNGHNGGSYPTLTLPQSGIRIKWPAYRFVIDAQSSKRDGTTPEILPDNLYEMHTDKGDALMQQVIDLISKKPAQ